LRIWRKPRALVAGDEVGVCAPAGPIEPKLLQAGVLVLEGIGLRVRIDDAVGERQRFTAGSIERRGRGLSNLLGDPNVKAVVAARGGAGSGWLLRDLDPRLFESPKAFLGCSDLTFLHLALNRARTVSLHGPMVAGDLGRNRWDRTSLEQGLFGSGAPYQTRDGELLSLREGEASGRLLGGCLSILASACGTPWALRPDVEGTLLFLEDVNEPPYRVDRMILQMREAGAFEGVRGIVFGQMPGSQAPEGATYTLEDVILDALGWFEGPIAVGLPSGHTTRPAVTLPLGCGARLQCEASGRASFAMTESPVS
jgi:muramoyltetrapeptide carboxypeptidase